ncbi:FlgD immunoglobulin-like domain containing protein [Candidatus Eisenbacteria bacterium]|uniref:FlgD immunoglobulin-like domain containing protein n=1 Tax=Eiseniibacteriota bacterium TaxID=2212470 RepID=A0ABV6YL78_UNCEI
MLNEFGEQLVVLDAHTSEQLAMGWGSQRRNWYGGEPGVPYVRIDGVYGVLGAGSCSGAANAYRPLIQSRLNAGGGLAPVSIEGVWLGDLARDVPQITARATFKLEDPVTLVNTSAFLVVLEDNVLNTFDHIVRKVYQEAVTLTSVGDSVVVEYTWDADWDDAEMLNVNCIAFIQNLSGNKEIYQVSKLEVVPDYTFTFNGRTASIPEGNGVADFTGTLVNIGDSADNITVDLNDTFGGWTVEFKVEGEADYHTEPSIVPLAIAGEIDVYLRVSTDDELRVGSGGLRFDSESSGRWQTNSVRIFNGTYAVLAVDDDRTRVTTAVYDALTGAGYLFDQWEAFTEHNDETPTTADLLGYDLVVWYQGISQGGFTAAEEQVIMDYMDSGRGLIFASQQLLNSATLGPIEEDYFGIASWTLNVQADSAFSAPGDPVGSGIAANMSYIEPEWFYDKADEVIPNAIGTTFLLNEVGESIGIRADNGTARCVFFSCALVAMDAGPTRIVIDNALRWIQGLPPNQQDVADDIARSQSTTMWRITPNPYSITRGPGTAAIRLRLSDEASRSPVTLDLLDLNGRLVRNLVQGALPAGISTATWDGRDVAGRPAGAGVYFVRFSTIEGDQNQRMVVIQ